VRIGLVLGAGGVIGGAYLAGALAALEHDLGWDPRTADVIVGTSAGALVGGLLRRDVPASDLAAWTVDAPLSPTGAALTGNVERPQFDAVTLRQFLRPPRVPHTSAVVAALRSPHRFDPLRALITHLPDGPRTLAPHVEFLGGDWPERALWVNAVRRRDGRRVVLGRDAVPDDGLAAAVAASCAVPGYFAPVAVDGTYYIDGGVKSPSNADVLRAARLDLVVAVSPMSSAVAQPPWGGLDALVRRRAGHRLRAELARVGVPAVVFEPGAGVLACATLDFMSDDRRQEIVAAAFLETGEQALDSARAPVLAPLAKRHAAA